MDGIEGFEIKVSGDDSIEGSSDGSNNGPREGSSDKSSDGIDEGSGGDANDGFSDRWYEDLVGFVVGCKVEESVGKVVGPDDGSFDG